MDTIEDLEVTEDDLVPPGTTELDTDDSKLWFVSGPMRGVPQNNFPRFKLVTDYLRSHGQSVWSPHEAFGGDTSRPLKDYFAEDLSLLPRADSIVFLPGWQNSAGARIEYLLAKELGLSMHLVFFHQFPEADEYVFDVVDMRDDDAPVELEAGRIVRNGERQASYGHPLQDFHRTAGMWTALGLLPEQDPADVAIAMASLKLSRLKGTKGHYDSIVDAIGYLTCYARITREGLS